MQGSALELDRRMGWLRRCFKTVNWKSGLLSLSLYLAVFSCGTALIIAVSNSPGSQGGSVSGERFSYSSPNWRGNQPANLPGNGSLHIWSPEPASYGYAIRNPKQGNTRRGIEYGPRFGRNQRYVQTHSKGWIRRLMAGPTVPHAVLSQTKNQRLRESMLLGSSLEGGWQAPYPVGDQGTSFGPYQMHEGGALSQFGLTPRQAENANTATKYMLPSYSAAVNQISDQEWKNNPEQAAEQAAVIAEKPAQDYYSSQGTQIVNQNWRATQDVLKGKKSTGGFPVDAKTASFGDWVPALGGILGNMFGLGQLGVGGFKDAAERIGLILLGGLLIVVGIVIFAIPAARAGISAASGTAVSANRGLRAAANIGGAQAADQQRRQAIADRSIAIGEKKVALQQQRENRLAANQAARARTKVPRASAG